MDAPHRGTHRQPPRRPHLLTLDDLGAAGWPLHVRRLPTLGAPSDSVSVAACYLALILTHGRGSARHLESVDIQGGDIHLIPVGMPIQLLRAGDLAGWLVGFDPPALRLFAAQSREDTAAASPLAQLLPKRSLVARGLLRVRPGPARWERILQLVGDLEAEVQGAAWGAQEAARALLLLILIELQRELQEHAPRAPVMASSTVREALDFLERHCLEPIAVAKIAAAVGRSPSHLAHAVRRETGLTIGDWLREHRMVEARQRLLGTAASIESIAREVGYADVTHFIRTFRRAHGLTPRVWRERHRPAAQTTP